MIGNTALRSVVDHLAGRPKTAHPTRHHYIEACLPELRAHGLELSRLGQHCVVLSDAGAGRRLAVVVRYVSERDLGLLAKFRARAGHRVAWLVDDNLLAMAEDKSLSAGYRERIGRFLHRQYPRLAELVDLVVAPSVSVLEAHGRWPGHLLHPAALTREIDLSHHDSAEGGETIETVFLGTHSHTRDFARVAPGLAEALERNPALRITTFLGEAGGRVLEAGPRVVHMRPVTLATFQSWLGRSRFHVGLAPYASNAVNDGRSVVKLHQHAALGAAGLYTPTAVFAPVIAGSGAGRLVEHEPSAFRDALLELAGRADLRRDLARRGGALSLELGNHRRMAAFWHGLVIGGSEVP